MKKRDNKKIVIYGGGTISHIRSHLGLAAIAYGNTARKLAKICAEKLPNFDIDLRLTKMAGGDFLETNEDISEDIDTLLLDDKVKVIIMSAALVDYEAVMDLKGKYADRLSTEKNPIVELTLKVKEKIISKIRKNRKDIFLVGFKTTTDFTEEEQYIAGLNLCKKSSCNLVLANDVVTRLNMVITPEESKYHVTKDRDEVLNGLCDMIFHRTHLTFVRSTVISGEKVNWDSNLIPNSLRRVIEYCINNNAYKPFNGVTTGHFAFKVDDQTFITSIRRTDFNQISKNGMVMIKTDKPDTILAYGAKPSVGGQSQRIIFKDHKGYDCIVHFHCPLKAGSQVPIKSQYEFECGSIECGENTSHGLKEFGNLKAVYLDEHGPNIIFNKDIDPNEVINFIENNFDLSLKTGGFVSIHSILNTNNVLTDAKEILK
jgi:hypothetical protein